MWRFASKENETPPNRKDNNSKN
ncbi:hypothetical protein A2U01_0103976, partial [Trifolium medium]|nr:hypothetical protein [Trifolium medium]